MAYCVKWEIMTFYSRCLTEGKIRLSARVVKDMIINLLRKRSVSALDHVRRNN